MKKQLTFNFVINNVSGKYDLYENPYSSITGTMATARAWAEVLLNSHRNSDTVRFISNTGRRIYSITREQIETAQVQKQIMRAIRILRKSNAMVSTLDVAKALCREFAPFYVRHHVFELEKAGKLVRTYAENKELGYTWDAVKK